MKCSNTIQEIAKALVSFQKDVKNPSKSDKGAYGKYAPLDKIINGIKPLLVNNGLTIIQSVSGDGQQISVTTIILHISGEFIETDPFTIRAERVTAQGAGSAVTYARRYSLSAALNIASEEDDDAEKAKAKMQEAVSDYKKSRADYENERYLTRKEINGLLEAAKGDVELCRKACFHAGYGSSKDVQHKDYAEILKYIVEAVETEESAVLCGLE